MAGKSYDVSHEDLVNMVHEETKYAKKDIDEAIDAYEKSISKSVEDIVEKDPDFKEINVYSKVSGYTFGNETDAEYGKTISVTPLVPKDLFDEINKDIVAESKMEEALNSNEDKKTAKKAS